MREEMNRLLEEEDRMREHRVSSSTVSLLPLDVLALCIIHIGRDFQEVI